MEKDSSSSPVHCNSAKELYEWMGERVRMDERIPNVDSKTSPEFPDDHPIWEGYANWAWSNMDYFICKEQCMSDPTADYWKAIIASIRSLNTDLIARSRVRRRVPQSLVFMDVSRLRDRDGQSRPWEQYPWRCDIHTYIRVLIGAKAEPDDRGKCSGASIQVARMHAMEELRHDNHSLIFASHQQRESMLEADEATTISADVYPITSGQSQVASQNRESQPVLQLSEAQEKSSTSPPPS